MADNAGISPYWPFSPILIILDYNAERNVDLQFYII